MTDTINLRKFRKIKQRDDKQKLAQVNRNKFGRTKQERLEAKNSKEKLARHLNAHLLDKEEDK